MHPPPPVIEPPSSSTRTLRTIAIVTICSTPISGIICFAIAAVLFGEDRLEDSNGLTTAGWLATGTPVIIGLILLLWSFSTVPRPNELVAAALFTAATVLCVLVGISSLQSTEPGDPNIGGPLILFFAIPLAAIALMLWIRQSKK